MEQLKKMIESIKKEEKGDHNKVNDLQRKIDEKIRLYRKKLLKNLGYDEALKELQKNYQKNCNSIRQAALIYAFEVWEGKHGKGVLVVLDQDEFSRPEGKESRFRLARIIDVSEDKKHQDLLESRLLENCWNNIGFLSQLMPNNGLLGQGADANKGLPELAEVDLGQPTSDELAEVHKKVKERMHPAEQIQLLGESAIFKINDKFKIADCSHHSGNIRIYLIYLGLKKWAVVAKHYDSDRSFGNEKVIRVWCAGIVTNPKIKIDYSAKYGGECEIKGDSTPPTEEEKDLIDKIIPANLS